MKFHVAQLLKEPVGTTRDYSIHEHVDAIGDVPLESPLTGQIRLMRINRGILVKGHLQTRVVLECSRCLSEFAYQVDLEINDQFWQKVDIYTGRSISRREGEELDLEISEDHILDLTEAVRQYVLVNLPLKPLCREDCQGMCPSCGANLNDGLCACTASNGNRKHVAVDARLSSLARLLNNPDS